MTVEKTDNEIIIRLPKGVDIGDLESVLKYFRFRELVSKSQATQAQINEVVAEMNKNWWVENQHRFLK